MAFNKKHPTKKTIITILIATLTLTLTAAVNPLSRDPVALFHDVLKANGLPIGLFPKGISDFSHDADSGHFELRLLYPSPCDTKFETHVRYQCNITGSVGYGRIANLSGVAAQELFLWLPVNGVHVDVPSSGLIYFDVGVIFKQFSLSFFEAPKDCDALEDGGEDDVIVLFGDREKEQFDERKVSQMRKEEPFLELWWAKDLTLVESLYYGFLYNAAKYGDKVSSSRVSRTKV